MACEIEIDRLAAPIGRQDQYIAAVGGVTAFEFLSNDSIRVHPVDMAEDTRARLEENLLLFYTGVRRAAADELSRQAEAISFSPDDLRENLDAVRELGWASRDAMRGGDLEGFAELLTEQWKLKYRRSPSPLHDEVDGWIRAGLDGGAGGGKLVGAGGGGFLLFYAEKKANLRGAMRELGLEEVRFNFDYEGAATIVSR
jgi:D-glycero-alpha-D-manno-heptose-7-phosphate kinase